MSSSKKARVAAISRDHRGRFLKTKNNNIQFLALPPEVRAMIYVYAFSDDLPYRIPEPYGTTVRRKNNSVPETRALAKPKRSHRPGLTRRQTLTLARIFPLLLACNSILAEAMPILYKCHTFLLEMPSPIFGKYWNKIVYMYNGVEPYPFYEPLRALAPYGQLITRLELGNVAEVWKDTWHMETSPNFPELTASFPNLRFLRLNIKPSGTWESNYTDHDRYGSVKWERWDQLLAHLVDLEFVITHFGDEAVLFREAIAPGPRWVRKTLGAVGPEALPWSHVSSKTLFQSVWSLQRSGMPKQGTHQAGKALGEIV